MKDVEFLVVDWYEPNRLAFEHMLHELGVEESRIHLAKNEREAREGYDKLTSKESFVPLVIIAETKGRNKVYELPVDLIKKAKQNKHQVVLYSDHPLKSLEKRVAMLLGDQVGYTQKSTETLTNRLGICYDLLQAGFRAVSPF